jgi:hypothetical protein
MTQEEPICKFCLDTNESKRNPLIEPCDCRGSMQFVHEQCLTRWRRLNPTRNADICLLCFHPYRLGIGEVLEHLPDESSFIILFLRYPIILCFAVNYVGVMHYSLLPKQNIYLFFEVYQYIFQGCFFVLFARIWKVKNKTMYWQAWNCRSFYTIVLIHVLCNYYIHTHEIYAFLPLNWVMGYYYSKHRQILYQLNHL